MSTDNDTLNRFEALYDDLQALKGLKILDRDMFHDGAEVTNDDMTLAGLIDRMLSSTVDVPLHDSKLEEVFQRFQRALPTHEHFAVFRRRFDAEMNARWPVRIESFEDLRALITLGGQDALYKYGDALFYLQQLRREDLEEKQKELKQLRDLQERAAEQSELNDQAFEAWIAVIFAQQPGLLNQYQMHHDPQNEMDDDPVSDTLATAPLDEQVMPDDSYIPDKGTQKDMVEFVHARLDPGTESSGHAPDYDQTQQVAANAPDQANAFEQAAGADADPVPGFDHLKHG